MSYFGGFSDQGEVSGRDKYLASERWKIYTTYQLKNLSGKNLLRDVDLVGPI